jgi:hypothetical protein
VNVRRVGGAGVGWLRSSLEDGLSLAGEVLRSTNLEEGEAYAVIPPDAPNEVLYEFEHGAKNMRGSSSDEVLVTAIRNLVGTGSSLLFVEDDRATPGDPFLEQWRSETVTLGDEVYHWLVLSAENVGEVADFIIRSSSGYPTNAVISSTDTETSFGDMAEISAADIKQIIQQLEAVIVTAYDCDGYVLWLPKGR